LLKLFVYHLHQDDPRKCSALKLSRFGLVQLIHRLKDIPRRAVILDPLSEKAFSPTDGEVVKKHGLVAIDCSWLSVEDVFKLRMRGVHRCLPYLIAANPVNFSAVGKLTTAEALAAALFIIGEEERARLLLSKFKWGPTFFSLNKEPLQAYQEARNSEEVIKAQAAFRLAG
jgi:pre-rRNA-processing protein TSR3